MAKFAFYISKRATVKGVVQISADTESEAREKYAEFIQGNGKDCNDQKDGQIAESVYDLKWDFESLDRSDNPVLDMVWTVEK